MLFFGDDSGSLYLFCYESLVAEFEKEYFDSPYYPE